MRDELCKNQGIVHFDPAKQLFAALDASGRGMGAFLFHVKDGYVWPGKGVVPQTMILPIQYMSRRLVDAETRYFATELEVACLCWVLRKARSLIQSSQVSPVYVLTDHGATPAITRQVKTDSSDTTRATTRLMRASLLASQFDIKCIHIPGSTNTVPDAMSRLPGAGTERVPYGELDLDWEDGYMTLEGQEAEGLDKVKITGTSITIAEEEKDDIKRGYMDDKTWKRVVKSTAEDTDETQLPYVLDDGLLYLTEFGGRKRLVIPGSHLARLFRQFHDENDHCGETRMYYDIRSQFVVWKLLAKIQEYVSNCPTCGENQTTRKKKIGRLQPILAPPIPFHTIAMDFVVGLPPVAAELSPFRLPGIDIHDAILTVTDKFSKSNLLIAGHTTYSASQWAHVLWRAIQLSNWSPPSAIISDRDSKFTGEFWKALWKSQGTMLRMSTAWHPQTDGQSERTNQTMEIAIRFLAAEHPDKAWNEHLATLQHRNNNTHHDSIKCTPNDILYGFSIRQLPNETEFDRALARDGYQEAAKLAIARGQMFMKERYDGLHRWVKFEPGDWVYVEMKKYHLPGKASRKFGQQRFAAKVKRRVGNLAYELELPPTMNMHPVVSVQWLTEAIPPGRDPYKRDHKLPGPVEPAEEDDDGEWRDEYEHYEVERIEDKRVSRGRIDYLVKWAGWPKQFNVWMRKEAIEAEELIREYEESRGEIEKLQEKMKKRSGGERKIEPGEVTEVKEQTTRKSGRTGRRNH